MPWGAVPSYLSVSVPTESHVSNAFFSGLKLNEHFAFNITFSDSSPIFVGGSLFPVQVIVHFNGGPPMGIADPKFLILNTSDSSSFISVRNGAYFLGISQYSISSNSMKVHAYIVNCGNVVANGSSNTHFYANVSVAKVLVQASTVFLAAKGNLQARALDIEATATVSLFLVYDDNSLDIDSDRKSGGFNPWKFC